MIGAAILDKFEQLPPNAQKKARDFVQYLFERYVKSPDRKPDKKPLSEYGFVGMWKDRADLTDSTEWVKKQRQLHWGKNGKCPIP